MDNSSLPWWSQLRRRLRDDPAVWSLLGAALGDHPQTSGRLSGLRRYRQQHPSHSAWFAGTWTPGNTGVLVKMNITRHEQFWMTATSRATTGIVPRVLASDTSLNGLDVAWLALERLPYSYDSAWGAEGFSALLEAAARFQVFAATVETDLVRPEGTGALRRWVLGGRDLCPEAAVLVRNLERDWAWVIAAAEPEVMFGDLHFGNAAFRYPPPGLQALLFDPIPRRQPWPFEPAYLEFGCGGSGLVREMAAIRTAQGRPTCGTAEIDRLTALFRGWLALLAWGTQPYKRPGTAWRTRLITYVTAAARLDW